MLFSIVVTFLLVRYLTRIATETNSIVIKADALHYKTDLWSNGAVLLALGIVYLTGLDIIDALFGLAIGMYIIYSAYEIIEEGVMMLLDRSLDKEIVNKIETILSGHPEVTGHHWLKTRTDGTTNFIEFHMVLQPDMLLLEAHRIAEEVEEKIMALEPDKRWVITPHFDPYDDEHINEAMFHGIEIADREKRLES
jgi:cation diffusion facilitator family transporter